MAVQQQSLLALQLLEPTVTSQVLTGSSSLAEGQPAEKGFLLVRPSPERDLVPVTRRNSIDRIRERTQPGILLNLTRRPERVVPRGSLKGVAWEGPAAASVVICRGCSRANPHCCETEYSAHCCCRCNFLEFHRGSLLLGVCGAQLAELTNDHD